MLHRDVKPDNVLVVDNHVRVMDFGLAAETNAEVAQRDGNDVVAGTIAYMPREFCVANGPPANRICGRWASSCMRCSRGVFPSSATR
ncbi:protein kinase [bacterium]|nr:protein kinase [bacterium]